MLSYSKINKVTGILVGIFASIIYVITAEASGSFWDCGEYVSTAAKLQNAHPPGNPFFALLGRLFIVFLGDNPMTTAKAVNILSAVSSGATIMFLFWITTYFAKKIVLKNKENNANGEIKKTNLILIILAGLMASLTFTFTDSFWFNAVEGEVYALANFLSVLMFYLMIIWEGKAHEKGADKYIILIALIIGLAVGIHLLDLLVIPALTMIYYYKKFTPTTKGIIIAFLIGCGIVGVVMVGALQYTVLFAANFDRLFVNTFGLPIFSGFFSFFILLIGVSIFYLRHAIQKGKYYLQLGLWCFLMIMLGYSTYNVVLIRSQADVSIDMNSPEDPMSLVNYIFRLQYGSNPLLYGPVFTAGKEIGKTGEEYQPKVEEDKTIYAKKKDEQGNWIYAPATKTVKVDYHPDDKMIFPRVHQTSNERGNMDFYANWLGISKVQDPTTKEELYERAPTFGENIKWFLGYQFGWMYLRYMMWNFVGRQNDIQGFGDARDGNAISGIGIVDKMLVGTDQSILPSSLKNHASHNRLFAIPLILAIIGLLFHYKQDRDNFIINLVFYFFSGIAIILYLNEAGPTPRERDYAHTVSFLAVAVWMGLSVLSIFNFINKYIKKETISIVAIVLLTIISPALVASQEWNDHNRGGKTLVSDYARLMLSGCPKNAVLFSYGDNDTYPLWYVQEVEGFRKDVRIMNTSLLGIDWYVNQLRYKVNESDSVELIFTPNQIFGNRNDYIFVHTPQGIDPNAYYDMYDVFKNFVATDNDSYKLPLQNGEKVNFIPTKKLLLKVDKNAMIKNDIIAANETKVSDKMTFEIGKNQLSKSDLVIFAILASSINKRPICFTSESDCRNLGFGNYIQKRGMIYQVVPFDVNAMNSKINTEKSYDLFGQINAFGKMNQQEIYYDETNRQQLIQMRESYAELALALSEQNKDNAKAIAILNKINVLMPNQYIPYGMVSRYNSHNRTSMGMMQTAFVVGADSLANMISDKVKKDLDEQAVFYKSLPEGKRNGVAYEEKLNADLLKQLAEIKQYFQQRTHLLDSIKTMTEKTTKK